LKSATTQRLRDLVGRVGWPAAEAALVEAYPGEAERVHRYRAVYERLVSLEPVPCDFVLRIEPRQDDHEEWLEVLGEDGSFREDGELERFALELMPWSKWLGVAVPEELRRELGDAEIVAHCLYEMTFAGFDEETIQAEVEELSRRVRELDEMTPEEREKHLIPWEEVRARLMDRLTE
jgi:hypothetical protein